MALRSAFDPSMTNSIPCAGSRPRSSRSESSALTTVAFSVSPSHSPSGTLTPSVVIPNATIIIRPLSYKPIDHHRRQSNVGQRAGHQRPKRPLGALLERPRDRALGRRTSLDLDLLADRLLRAPVAARRDAGQHPLHHDPLQRVAVGEVLTDPHRHLAAAVLGAHPRPLDLQTPTAEPHRPVIGPMPVRGPVRVVLVLWAAHLLDLLGHHLRQHAKPDSDAQRQQPLLRCPHELPERLLDPRRQRLLDQLVAVDDLHGRYGLHGGSSCSRRRSSNSDEWT